MIDNSYDLFLTLEKMDLLKNHSPYWWPSISGFEIIVGVILTQNTKWDNVEKSLKNLRNYGILTQDSHNSLLAMAHISKETLMTLIQSSGFYRQKSLYLIMLSQHILEDFINFDYFCQNVSREWLLMQKGIGKESADSILNYACNFPIMVVDRYTQRLVNTIGYEFDDYDSLQEWLHKGIEENLHQLKRYKDLSQIYACFHGMIVEFSKKKIPL